MQKSTFARCAGANLENKNMNYLCAKCGKKKPITEIHFVQVAKVLGYDYFNLCHDCYKKLTKSFGSNFEKMKKEIKND